MASGSTHWSPKGIWGVPPPRRGPSHPVASSKGLRTSPAGSGGVVLSRRGSGGPAVPPTSAAGAWAGKGRGADGGGRRAAWGGGGRGGGARAIAGSRSHPRACSLLPLCLSQTTAPLYGAWPCYGLFPSMTSLHGAHAREIRSVYLRGHGGSQEGSDGLRWISKPCLTYCSHLAWKKKNVKQTQSRM